MMNDLRSLLRRSAVSAVLVAAIALAGCTKKPTSVDATYTTVEGRASASSQQIATRDLPATVYRYQFAPTGCDTCVDELVSVTEQYPNGSGFITGAIFDGSAASTFQMMRRESNGGYAPLFDYDLNPVQRFAQSGWKLFTWRDARPSGYDPPSYVGRGVVTGVVTATSPLTNVSEVHAGDVQEIAVASPDSLQNAIAYTPVSGAVAYVLQVYLAVNHLPDAYIFDAAPSAFATQDHLDFYDIWCPANQGIIDNGQVKILAQRNLIPVTDYSIRMVAVDAQGRLIGFSYGDPVKTGDTDPSYYRVVRRGAFQQKSATKPRNGALTFSPMDAPLRARLAAETRVSHPTR